MYIKMELPRRLLIGLSGGADSVALAYLLLQRREELELRAVHVNHGLRGKDSDADEAFVRELCERWQLPLDVYHAQPPEHPGEDWAREARYAFYRDVAAKHQADAVALAHHRDDQAETLLLHLLRGTGLTGLTGMAADGEVLGVRIIRPLLEHSRQELRDVLTQAGIQWREDASNQDARYLRNAVRLELLPLMERLAPGASQRMAATAGLLREDDAALDSMARSVIQNGAAWLPVSKLQDLQTGVLHRVLRMWWQRYAGHGMDEHALNRQQTLALAALVEAPAGSKCNLPGDCHGYRGWTHLHLLGRETDMPAITLAAEKGAQSPGDGRRTQAMPEELYAQCVVRTRAAGDWIRPFGQTGRQTMQDYFTNRKLDAPFRDAVRLLCRGSEVLLVSGVGAGDVPPFDPEQKNVTLTWMGDMPWTQK